MENQVAKWDDSYRNRGNFVFYPNEQLIRFCSKYIRKRVGFNEFIDVASFEKPVRVLDIGCGIGRHVIFSHAMGLEAYGFDLSPAAIEIAREWAAREGMVKPQERLVQADIRQLPWHDHFFDFALSHGVLDSMHFSIARAAIGEVHRVMIPGGLFYCDLISGDNGARGREYAGEEEVKIDHERGTIQSYFNYSKIERLIDGHFTIVEAELVRRENLHNKFVSSRYHLVLRAS